MSWTVPGTPRRRADVYLARVCSSARGRKLMGVLQALDPPRDQNTHRHTRTHHSWRWHVWTHVGDFGSDCPGHWPHIHLVFFNRVCLTLPLPFEYVRPFGRMTINALVALNLGRHCPNSTHGGHNCVHCIHRWLDKQIIHRTVLGGIWTRFVPESN